MLTATHHRATAPAHVNTQGPRSGDPRRAAGRLRSPRGRSLRPCCLLGPPSERQRNLRRATDIVLIEYGAVIYWPRTGEQFQIRDAAYAMARVQATLA